jgi:hypothetical protein
MRSKVSPFGSLTVILSAGEMTWRFVTMVPDESIRNPEPELSDPFEVPTI